MILKMFHNNDWICIFADSSDKMFPVSWLPFGFTVYIKLVISFSISSSIVIGN